MPDRMDILRERSKPSRGSVEHQKLKAELGGIEPGSDHPSYDDFIRLTESKTMGRPVSDEVGRGDRPKAGTPEYTKWWRDNTEVGQVTYKKQLERQHQEYHDGPEFSGADRRALQRYKKEYRDRETPVPAVLVSEQEDRKSPEEEISDRTQEAKRFYEIDDDDAADQLARQHLRSDFPTPLTTKQYEQEGKTRWWPYEHDEKSGEDRPVVDSRGVRVSAILRLATSPSWEITSARQTPGQQSADKFLRAVEPGDIERLIREHDDNPDPRDKDLGVATGGGGHERETVESYPAEGHYRRRFSPSQDHSEPARSVDEDPPIWDRDNWDNILGQAGFQYKPHPNPTVSGFYWRPDQPNNDSSLGYRIEHPSSWEPYWKAHYGQGHRDGGASIGMSQSLHNIIGTVAEHNSRHQWSSTGRTSAAKAKPKKPRSSEEVWYDVHKHPEGTPGGMGKSPQHHLKNRGWTGHEINETSGKKTIQYRHKDMPDFVISYGGGTGTKPDHNFRVLHMGPAKNVPKITPARSVAEAMDKAEELHGLSTGGFVVQPMTHGASNAPSGKPDVHPIGPPKIDFPTDPLKEESDWYKGEEVEDQPPQRGKKLKQKAVPDPPKITPPGKMPKAYALAQQSSWEY